MNVLKRRVLLLVLLVIALFGLTILGASAATDAPQGVLETAKDPSATYVASATVTVGSDTATYYYTSLTAAIADADADTTVTVLANTETGAITIDKSLKIVSSTGIVVTKTSGDYLFTISNDAVVEFGNITFATNGGFLTASGTNGSVTLGNGTTVTGAAGAKPFFNVTTAYTNGTITMAEGSKLEVTGAPATAVMESNTGLLFHVTAATAKIDLQGTIVVGTEEAKISVVVKDYQSGTEIKNSSCILFYAKNLSEITYGGDIDIYYASNKVTFLTGGTAKVNFTGALDFHVYGANAMIQMVKDNNGGSGMAVTVDGATINMTHDTGTSGNNANYSAMFYMYSNNSSLTMTSGSITVGTPSSNEAFPWVYSDYGFDITISGNSTIINNCANYLVRGSRTQTDRSHTVVIAKTDAGSPTITTSYANGLFYEGNANGLNAIILDGVAMTVKTNSTTRYPVYYADDATAAANGYVAYINKVTLGGTGTYKNAATPASYYTTFSSAVAAAKTGDTITVIGNTTVSSAFAITDKSITITTAEGVTLTVNATISIGNGATVTFSGATISGSGNNESAPFALTATTTKGTLKFVNSTVTVAKDLISVSGSSALLGDVIADKSTLNVKADTLFDYRNKNASTSVSFTAQNGCQLNVANLNYTTVDTLGALKVTVINSTVTSTAKTFFVDSTAAITLDLTIQDSAVSTTSVLVQTGSSTKVKLIAKFIGTKSGTTDANATFTNSVQATSHIFDLYGKTADSVDISITGTKLTTNERVFNVQALAQPAAGKGFTDADGKGNFAMRVNVENVHATCRYFFITQTTNTVGNVLFVMNGTKTGAGASAVHSNVITLSTGAFIYLDDVVSLSQFRVNGVKASFTSADGQNLVLMTGNGHTIDMEFEGITFASTLHSNGRVFSGNDGKSLNTLRLVIKDSNLTANDKSTYSNEISSKEIAFLLRSFRNLDISAAGTIFAGGTTFNVQTPVVSEENLSCSITLTDVSSTSGGALVSTKALTCDFFLTLTNVDMVASKLIDFATSYAKTATITATNSKITKSSVAYDVSGSYKLTKDSAVITHTGDHYSVLKNLITGVCDMVLYATTGTNEYTYFAALNQAVVDATTANATRPGVITLFANVTPSAGLKLGDGTDDADNYKTYDLTITGVKVGGATAYPTITYNGELFVFYDGSDLTLSNINIVSANRWMRIYNKNCTNHCSITFGAGTTVTQNTTSSNDDFILADNGAYVNITVEQGATLSRTLTAASTSATKMFFSTNNMKGVITIAGTLVYNCNSLDDANAPTPAYYFNASGTNAKIVIKSTANITFNPTGESAGSAIFANMVLITVEGGMTYNGTTYATKEAAAVALGLPAMFTHTDGATYFANSVANAISYVNAGGTVTVLTNTSLSNIAPSKKFTITGLTSDIIVTNSDTNTDHIFIDLYDGADITFTNITFKISSRFARSYSGTAALTFGNGAKIISTNSIFFYANSVSATQTTTVNFDFQAGSVIESKASNLIYHNLTNDWNGDGTKENRILITTIKIAGTMKLSGSIANDTHINGSYTVYFDATTANVTSATDAWFVNVVRRTGEKASSTLYAKGFASTAAAAEWGYKHTDTTGSDFYYGRATGMTYSADPDREWNYTFIGYNQFMDAQWLPLNTFGGEIWQLRTVPSIYATAYLYDMGTVTLKSYNGATITAQNVNRVRVQNTTLILDGFTFKLETDASIAIHGGSAEKPSLLKLINGAKITGAAYNAGQMIYFMNENGTSYGQLYVDETSSIVQTKPSSTLAGNTHLVWIHGNWTNVSITIKGTLSSAATAGGKVNFITFNGSAAGSNVLFDGAKLEFTGDTATKYMVDVPANSFAGKVVAKDTELTYTRGLVVRNGGTYYGIFANALADIPDGGTATLNFLEQATFTNIEINNKFITLVGADSIVNDKNYDLKFSGSSGYAILLTDAATLTFQNMSVFAGRPLFQYGSTTRTDIAKVDRDITLNFVNSWASGGSSSSVFLGGGTKNEACDTITVNVDKTSELVFTPNSSSNSAFFNFTCGSHTTAVVNVEGTLTVDDNYTAEARRLVIFLFSAPTNNTVNVTKDATITVKDAGDCQFSYFSSGTTATNFVNVHVNAITDENGASTLNGTAIYNVGEGCAPQFVVTAPDTTTEKVLTTWYRLDKTTAVLDYRMQVNGEYRYYSELSDAISDIPEGGEGVITIVDNATLSTVTEITNKKVTLKAVDNVTLTVNASIKVGNGATLIVDGVTVSGTGNNESSPFVMTSTTSKGTLKFINATVTASSDLVHFGGSSALLAEVIVDASTLNVTVDTTFDYRTTNANSVVSITVKNGTVWNAAAAVYSSENTKGTLNLTVENSEIIAGSNVLYFYSNTAITLNLTVKDSDITTAGHFLFTDTTGALTLNAELIGTKTGTGNTATFTTNITSTNADKQIFMLQGTASNHIDITATGVKFSTVERVFNVVGSAQPAEGEGFTDADGKGNFAVRITVEDVYATCRYFFLTGSKSKGDVLFVMNGTKTGTGTSAIHSNEINITSGAFLYFGGSNDLTQVRVNGVTATATGQHILYTAGGENTIDMEFEGITFDASTHSNGRVLGGNSGTACNNLRLVIKDSDYTANNSATYSNEIKGYEIAFLVRSFRNVDISITGAIITVSKNAVFNIQTPTTAEEGVTNSFTIALTDVVSTTGQQFIAASALVCDLEVTMTNVKATGSVLFAPSGSYAYDLVANVTNSTFTVGGSTYNVAGTYTMTSDTATITGVADQTAADVVALKAGYTVRTTADGATDAVYFKAINATSIDHATANGTKAGTITVLTNLSSVTFTLGDGVDDTNFKTYDLTIVGVKLLGATAYPTLSPSGGDAIKLYDASDITFRNITVSANFRWIRVYNAKGSSSNASNVVFGENAVALMNTTSSTTEDFIFVEKQSYANITFEEKATIQMTQTAAGGRKSVLAFNGAYGTVTIRGTINANITTLDSATNIILFQMGSSSGHIIIEPTAVINYNFGDHGTHYFVKDASITVVDAATKINGAALNDTTAKALGFNVRNNAADGTTAFYGINIGKPAYNYAGNVSTFTLLANANVYIYETITNKDITITSAQGNKFTLTLPSGYAAFNLGANTKLTLTNMTLNLGGNRFARVDGSTHVIFGAGTTVNCSANIFLYNNGQSGAANAVSTFDFQAGSVISCTTAMSNALIYNNNSGSAGGVTTVKLAGKITLNKSYLVKDVDKNSTYIVYYDASTAEIDAGQDEWFSNLYYQRTVNGTAQEGADVVWATGFKSHADADAWGYTHGGASFRTYNSDPNAEYEYAFVSGNSSFVQAIHQHLTGYDAEIMLLRNISNVWGTHHFNYGGTITLKSYNGAVLTVKGDAWRFRVENGTTVVLDGFTLKTGTASIGRTFMIHAGTAENHSTLKLINGSQIISTVKSSEAAVISFADKDCAYADLYIDATSSITQTGTCTGSTNVVYFNSGWSGTVTVEGTVSSSVAGDGYVVLFHVGGADSTGNFVIDGGKLELTNSKATNTYAIYVGASDYASEIEIKNATLINTATCTGIAAMVYVNASNYLPSVKLWAEDTTITFAPNGANVVSKPFYNTIVYFQDVEGAAADAKAVEFGLGVRYNNVYSGDICTALINLIPMGGSGDIYLIAPVVTNLTANITDRTVTVYGMDSVVNDGNYDYTYTHTSYAFAIFSKGTLTFKNLCVLTSGQFVDFNANTKVAGDKADKDVTINFVNTYVTANTAAGVFVGSRNHYSAGAGCGEAGDTVIVNIDKDSKVVFTTSATGNIFVISFNHNCHPTMIANIDGVFEAYSTAANVNHFAFMRSNNPNATQLNISETAKIRIDVAGESAEGVFFTTFSTGSFNNNLVNIHLDAITENGELTLDGAILFDASKSSLLPKVTLVGNSDAANAALVAWQAKLGGEVITPIAFRTKNGDTFYYSNFLNVVVNNAANNGIVYVLQDATTYGEAVIPAGVTLTIKSAPEAGTDYFTVIGGSAGSAPIFSVNEGSHLILDNITLVAGRFIRIDPVTTAGASVVIDFNSGATAITTDPAKDANFIYSGGGHTIEFQLIININTGAKMSRPDYAWASGTCYMINLLNAPLASGSAINVAGTMEDLINFTATSGARKSNLILANDADLTVNVTSGAVINFNAARHSVNQYQGMFNTTGVVNISGGVFNIYGDAEALGVFWLNSTSVYNFSGTVVFNAPGLDEFFYSYSSNAKVNFNNVTFTTNVSDSIKLTYKDNTPAISVINSTFSSAAVANLFNATVTLDNGNALSGRYDIASAVAAVESGATLYLQANSVIASTIVLDGKAITIAPAGDEVMTLALYSQNVGKMFVLKNGASITLNNLNVTITTDTADRQVETAGSFVTVDEAEANGAVKINLNNVNVSATSSIIFYFGGNSEIELVMNGGSLVGEGVFAIGYYSGESATGAKDGVDITSNAKLTATITGKEGEHVLIRRTAAGDQNAIIFVNFAGDSIKHKDQVKFDMNYVDLGREGASAYNHPIYLRGAAALTMNLTHGTMHTGGWVIGGQSGAAFYVNLTDVDIASTTEGFILRPYAKAGTNSYFNMVGGSVNAPKTAASSYVLSFNGNVAVSFTGTTFNVATNAPLFGREGDAPSNIVLDGCTFNMTGAIVYSAKAMNVILKGETKVLEGEELVALTTEIALARGFNVELVGAGVYATTFTTKFFDEVTDTYNKVLIHKNITILAASYITNKNVTIEGIDKNVTITAAATIRPLYIENTSNVTFKNFTANVYRFFTVNATAEDAVAIITLDNVDVIVPDYSSDTDALIYKGHAVGQVTLNINANSSIVMNSSKAPATDDTIYAAVAFNNGAGTTINVWGTIKNLMKTSESQNAQVITVKGTNNNAIVNIYDGAVLEGTSSSEKYTGKHSGSYCGIIYFSEGAGGNTLNIEGGTITVHGVTGLAYTGTKATINISGNAVINNVDAQYAMFFGGAQTLNIRGNENGKPVINTPKALMTSGISGMYAYDTGYSYETAKALGFTVALGSKDFFAAAFNRVVYDLFASEETLYLLANANMTQNCGGDDYKPMDNVKLTITSYGTTKYTLTTTMTGGSIPFWLSTNAHLIIDNVIFNSKARFVRFDNEDVNAYAKLELTGNAEVYASNSTDGNFIYSPYGAGLLVINIEEGAIIQRIGTIDNGKSGHLFNIGNAGFVEGSEINIKGTISNVANYTGTSKMSAYLFNVPDADIVVNVYPTAKFEMAMTKTNASAVIDERVFTPAGLVYFKDFAEGTDYDEVANGLGLALRTDGVENVYAKYLTAQFMNLVQNNGTIYVLNDFFFANSFTLNGKNVTIEGMRDGITLTQSATITLTGDSSITVKNMAIISSARFINSSTVTNGNTIKLDGVKITTSAGKDSDIILVSNSKAAIEITNCEFYSTTNRVMFVHASTNGTVTALNATNVKLNSALLRVSGTSGTIGSATAPAVLNDVIFETIMVKDADGKEGALSAFMYGYTGNLYVDIFGGSFKGQFFYGGDSNPNTIAIRVNPTGDKSTTISTLNPSTTSVYSALIHMNNGSIKDVTLAFRNTTLSDVGGQTALIQARTNTNLNIRIENSTFEGKAFLALGSNYSAVTSYFDSAETAKKFGFNVRLGENTGAGYYYLLVNLALTAAKDGDTIYLMGDAASVNIGNDTNRFEKKVHITSVDGAIYTITNSASIPFYLGNGAEVKFTNVTYNMAVRFARVDGNATLIFGEGTTLNCKDTIFIYANASALASTITLTVDFQAGSVLNWTAKTGKLIYHNGTKDLNGDGDTADTGEKYQMTTTVYISGEMNIASTTTGAITSDDNNTSSYNVWIDFTTAKINCTAALWFYHCEQKSAVYMTGLNSIEEYDAIARKASLAVRSGAKIGEGVWVPYTGFRGQINQIAIDVLPEGENTLYLLEDIVSINSTMHFTATNHDSYRIVSNKADGTQAVIGMQGDAFRIRVYAGAPLTLDNVKINNTANKGQLIQFHNGTAATPATLILTNGATMVSKAASAAFNFDTSFVLVKVESKEALASIDAYAKSFALKVRLDDTNGAIYTSVLSTNAVAYATQSGKKAATLTVLDSHSASVTLGDGADDAAFTPHDITIVGIKVNGATAYPTLTFATDAFKMYDGSDVTFSNINITSSYRWLRIYNTKCTDPCDIVFAAGATATQNTASSNDDFIYITGNSYCNLTVEKGATLSRTLTAANTTAYKTMISSTGLNGTITIAGTLFYDCTSILNSNSKPTPAYMFNASGANSAIVIKSTANITFTAKGECDGSRLCLNNTLVTIEGGMTVNNKACATAEDAAKELGLAFSYTANNGNKYFTHALAQATSTAANGSTIYVLCDITLTNSAYVTDKTLTLQGINDSIVVTTGEVKADGTISKAGVRMIYLSGNANLTIKDLNFVTNRFVSFTSSVASTGVLTLNNVDVTVPDYSVDMDALIYCGTATNKVVINIDANSSIVMNSSVAPASGTTVYATIAINNGVGTTINIWGTVKNLMKTVDGANAQVITVKGANNNAIVNIYEGAVLEGTSDSESYTGNYTGIIYFSEGKSGNELNIYGGEITIHGNTGLAYLGTSAKVNISGNVVINNIDNTKYELFGKTPVTIVITANDAGTPVFNFACKFVPNGVKNLMTATGFTWTDSVAAMLGFSIRSGETSFTNYISQTDVDAADTIYVLGNTVNVLDELVIDGKTLNIVNTGNVTATLVNSPFTTITRMFTLKNGATLTITNVNVTTTSDTVDRNVNTAGVFITVDETNPNGTVNVTLNNVTLNASKGIPFYFGSNSIVNVTINGGSYTGEGMFAIGYNAVESATGKGDSVDITSNATVNVTITGTHENHVLLRRTVGGDQNAVIFVNQAGTALANKDKVKFTLTHVDIGREGAANATTGIYLRNKAALTLEQTCGQFYGDGWLFASQANCAYYATFTDVDFTGTRTDFICRPYGAADAGSYININGGSITATRVAASKYILSFNTNITVSIKDTVISSTNAAPIFGTESGAGLSITVDNINISGAPGMLVHATKTPALFNKGIYMIDDAAAIAKGLMFRVGPEGGLYFNSIASAVAAVADGGKIYVLGNSTEGASDINLNKYVIFELVNAPAEGFTITHTGSGNLFLITEGSASAPVRVVMNNLTIKSTVATGAIFALSGNGYAIFELTNCTVNTTKGGVFNASGKASATVTIQGGSYTASYRPFYIVGESAFKFTAKDASFQGLSSGNDGTIFFFDNTNGYTGAVSLTFTDCRIFNTTSSGHGIYGMTTSRVDLNMTNVEVNVKGWCLSSQSNTTWHANLKNVTFITNSTNHAVRLYGAAGSYLNIEGGTFLQNSTSTSSNEAVLAVGNSITLNFFDGYIESNDIACITGLGATVTINIYGGTFRYTGNAVGVGPVSLPNRAVINVKGGNFITESKLGPVFSNVANSANTLNLECYNAIGNANLITNLGIGTPSAAHDAYGRTSLNTIVMTTGATPILTEGAMGLGFKAELNASAYYYLRGLAADSVLKFGMLVIPTDKLDESNFTLYGFQQKGLVEGVDYFNIKAGENDITTANDGCVVVKLALTNISEENYNTAYSVVFYTSYDVNFELNGELISTHTVYQYADYERSENSRSLAQVARAAYNDTSATQDSYYVNPVENTALYSHYTTEELAQLAIWCGNDTAQKTLDIFLIAGGSNAAGNTAYGNEFATDFNKNNSISGNVFYSGMISDYATETYGSTTLKFVASKYTAIGTASVLGMGAQAGLIGPELGMATELSKYYNSESGKYAAIMKYAFNDFNLVDVEGSDMTSAKFYNDFMQMVIDQIADY